MSRVQKSPVHGMPIGIPGGRKVVALAQWIYCLNHTKDIKLDSDNKEKTAADPIKGRSGVEGELSYWNIYWEDCPIS